VKETELKKFSAFSLKKLMVKTYRIKSSVARHLSAESILKEPVKSPLNLLQEQFRTDPWKVLISCMVKFCSILSSFEESKPHLLIAENACNLLLFFFLNYFLCFFILVVECNPWQSRENYCGEALHRVSGSPYIFGRFRRRSSLRSVMKKKEKHSLFPLFISPPKQHQGLSNKKAKAMKRFSEEFLEKNWVFPIELYGIGKEKEKNTQTKEIQTSFFVDLLHKTLYRHFLGEYANDCYRILCCGEDDVKPKDHMLQKDLRWKSNQKAPLEEIAQRVDFLKDFEKKRAKRRKVQKTTQLSPYFESFQRKDNIENEAPSNNQPLTQLVLLHQK
jgi:hypothetical protein